MTSAYPNDVFGPQLPGPVTKANWLGRYLEVERRFDKEIFGALKEAERSITNELKKIVDKPGIGAQTRRLQFSLARKTLRDYVDDLFGKSLVDMLQGYRKNAAEEAINAGLYDQRGLLAKLFGNPTDRENYADSLKQTARRNIEATITRILSTEMPLSQRVWKTRALANGQISTAINNGLARGDSAADIARAVRGFVSPETPGGISYAAKRLGRTEINNAFHAQAIADAQEKPWVLQMEWHLSKRHASDPGDLCESYALTRKFDKEHVPGKPHPNCRCFVTPSLPDYDTFETELIQGHYDSYIDRVLAGETYHVGGPGPTPGQPRQPKPASIVTVPEEHLASLAPPTEEVKWTGPHIAQPDEGVFEDIDFEWRSAYTYDERKDAMRKGARRAQQKGFRGFDDSRYGTYQAYGAEIVAKAVYNDPTKESLYRGIAVEPYTYDWQEGQKLSMPLSSFTSDRNNAVRFATHENPWISKDAPGANYEPIVFELESGARVAPIGPGSESVAFGQFEVTDVVETDNMWEKPTVVKIRQTSMIEATRTGDREVLANRLVPDVTVVDSTQTYTGGKAAAARRRKAYLESARKAREKRLGVKEKPKPKPRPKPKAEPKPKKHELLHFTEEQSSEEVAKALKKKYRGKLHVNFSSAAESEYNRRYFVTRKAGVEIGNAIDEMMEKYPSAGLDTIGVAKPWNDEGMTIAETDCVNRIHFNPKMVREDMYSYDPNHFHPRGYEQRPYYVSTIHEFGHVLDNKGIHKARDEIMSIISAEVKEIVPPARTVDPFGDWEHIRNSILRTWLKENAPSGYALNPATGLLDPAEALAEAFCDVEVNGDNAKPLSKALHKLLLRKAGIWKRGRKAATS